MRKPGPLFRAAVVATQGIFFWSFGLAYILSPRFCHRFVGYLEEEAVKTYTHLLEEIDTGRLPMFRSLAAPPIAREYYRLPADASLRDVFSCIRADESHHREVNHGFADINTTAANPFPPGY
uniref:Alternative oxidase n=1 Tax=Alexandrium catenella TaxID=2925 RepID=A0A7S1SDA0_ALECA